MEELIEKVENLKKALDDTKKIKAFKKDKKIIEQNKELIDKIKKYQETYNDSLKKEILDNKDYREYKKEETDINLLILEINNELKKINSKGKCHK